MSGTVALSREKLAAVLGRLGSDFDGEVVAAARTAERMRRQAGVTWQDIVAPGPPGSPRTPPPAEDWRQTVALCRGRPGLLTAWERDFLTELATYRHPPSGRQAEVLAGIARKVRGA